MFTHSRIEIPNIKCNIISFNLFFQSTSNILRLMFCDAMYTNCYSVHVVYDFQMHVIFVLVAIVTQKSSLTQQHTRCSKT